MATVKKRQAAPAAEARLEPQFNYPDDVIERSLRTGEHASELESQFGEQEYNELCELARRAAARGLRGGPRVLILPGIMGSRLGIRGKLLNDVIWFDPIDIMAGNATKLALNGAATKIEALGVLLSAYLKLKLRLQIAGFNADFYPYDWRLSISTLGQQLADALKQESGSDVFLVAHSMGGLVARAALKRGASIVKKLVMLGTPNFGSFSPVQALTGTNATVLKLAKLDLRHNAVELVTGVFATFPGLYEMIPATQRFTQLNMFDPASYPAGPPRPLPNLLQKAAGVQDALAGADDRFFLIAGVNQQTVVGAKRENGELLYEVSPAGDGTVPLAFAQLPNTKTYYVEEEHGSLPNNAAVAQAVSELLASGRTDRLPTEPPVFRRAAPRLVRASELRLQDPFFGRRGAAVRPSEMRQLLREFAAPDARCDAATTVAAEIPSPLISATADGRFARLTVSRRRQHRLDVQLFHGSITEVEARAYVLGIFREVAPSGAAGAIDEQLGGAITEFTRRRMFSGGVGEVFMLPANRHRLRAELVLFAGLGYFDHFTEDVQQLVAENVVRTFASTRVEDFATVLFGAGSGQRVETSLRNLLSGFVRGMLDTDVNLRSRVITICEADRDRYDQIKRELYRLASTKLFDDIEVTFDELEEPPVIEPVVRGALTTLQPNPVYLLVRQTAGGKKSVTFHTSILTAGDKAAVYPGTKLVESDKLDDLLKRIETPGFDPQKLGTELASMILDDGVALHLQSMQDRHLIVVHDAPSSRLPWETLCLSSWSPALAAGLSHRYMADNLSVAKYLERRRQGAVLQMLLVVNPTGDLPGADREGKRIQERFGSAAGVEIDTLEGAEATRPALLKAIQSGKYDVLHYAGHAFFDADHPAQSGVLCNGRDVLSGADLTGIGNLPSLVFFNACESGRIRSAAEAKKKALDVPRRIERGVGLAEAFLRGGVANFVGTYWPVGDDSAGAFSDVFYQKVLQGSTLNDALTAARKQVQEIKSIDWADYMHYGSHDFVLKEPKPGEPALPNH